MGHVHEVIIIAVIAFVRGDRWIVRYAGRWQGWLRHCSGGVGRAQRLCSGSGRPRLGLRAPGVVDEVIVAVVADAPRHPPGRTGKTGEVVDAVHGMMLSKAPRPTQDLRVDLYPQTCMASPTNNGVRTDTCKCRMCLLSCKREHGDREVW